MMCREKQLSAGLIANATRKQREAEQLLSEDDAKGPADLKVAEDSSFTALARLKQSELEIKASLAAFRKSVNVTKQSDAIMHLKANISDLFRRMKDRVLQHQYGTCPLHSRAGIRLFVEDDIAAPVLLLNDG